MSIPKIRILVLTHKRVGYTEKTLERLVATLPADARIWVWDNASGPEMKRLLDRYAKHPKFERLHFSEQNIVLREPTNWFWRNAKDSEFLGKVDDDCLMPDGWIERIVGIHQAVPKAGILGAWMFPAEDDRAELARSKVEVHGGHGIMRNCWVGGSGYLMKRSVLEVLGLLDKRESFTGYCVRAAAKGYINGWPYPLIYMDHMDDPRSPNTGIKSDADFQSKAPLTAATFAVKTLESWTAKQTELAVKLQKCSYDPSEYLDYKLRIIQMKRSIQRLIGRKLI